MRIGILTWYKAINHGAVLQTYASVKILEKLNSQPLVLDYDWNLNSDKKSSVAMTLIKRVLKISLKKIIWFRNVKHFFNIKSDLFKNFTKNELPLGKHYSKEEMDMVYIGSDMVFDIHEGFNPFMYGIGVPCDYIISYAASFGYTNNTKLIKSKYYSVIIEALKQFKGIGYRDNNTLEICNNNAIEVPMCENIDPVLAYGFDAEIENWDNGKWHNQNYVLIYAYDSTMNDKETVDEIRFYAQKHDLRIISCGYYHDWCDECVNADPKEFIEMFKHAKCIITDTFHGTVFSVLMHKQFVSIIRNNGFKIRYLLECAKLDNRIVVSKIADTMDNEIDFHYYDNWIKKERMKSIDFVKKHVEMAKYAKSSFAVGE